MRSRSRPGLRRSRAIWECPDWRPSGPVSLGKSGTWTGTAGFGPVQTGSQSVRDRTSPTLGHWGLSVSSEVSRKSMVHDSTPPLGAEPLQRNMDMLSQHQGAYYCSWRPKNHVTKTWPHSKPSSTSSYCRTRFTWSFTMSPRRTW